MFAFFSGIVAGILVANVGVLWLEYLASEQRPIRIEVDPRYEIASSSTRQTALPFTETLNQHLD
jgi:hypothetical protein